eukprot:TRINITY_DN75729_c0_g1_i1.p1 TRINITY_DN75729_c0_g1~~TRINITY_DN75729_c0_g1_i1.p1  ORF type:complete len:586 (-),score=106.41 TRINITY_DN75729_c0_g1_i1:135-1892(-)
MVRTKSYYKVIDKIRYDRALLETAEQAAADGEIDDEELFRLWVDAEDGRGITQTEKRTLDFIVSNFKLTPKAKEFLKVKQHQSTSYYKTVNGVKYDRELYEHAVVYAASDGKITIDEAKALVEEAQDGQGITEIEKRTLQHILDTMNFSDEAKDFITTFMLAAPEKAATPEFDKDLVVASAANAAAVTAESIAEDVAEEKRSADSSVAETAPAQRKQKSKVAEDAAAVANAAEVSEESDTAVRKVAPDKTTHDLVEAEQRIVGEAVALTKFEQIGSELENKYGAIFDKMDTSGDGKVSLEELRAYVSKNEESSRLELGIGRIENFIAEADTDGDGEISRDEFLAYFAHVNIDADKCFNALFDAIDANSDGHLTFEEVRNYQWYKNRKFFQLLGIFSWHSIVARMDSDGDGKISRSEFVTYLARRHRAGSSDYVDDFPEMKKSEPAWKKAMSMFVANSSQRLADSNICWDFESGYCYRGKRCHYKHDESSQQDRHTLDDHHKQCVELSQDHGVNLNNEAHQELQTLKIVDAEFLIRSLGAGGVNEHVWDKNRFVIGNARKIRMQAGSQLHPDWEWYNGHHKRRRFN